MGRHRRSGRKSSSVDELRERIYAARELDPDRTTLMSGADTAPADLRRTLRADAALRRSIAEGTARRPATSLSGATPADSTPAALRRRNSLNALAGSTRAAADPWSDQLERTYLRRRAERSGTIHTPTAPTTGPRGGETPVIAPIVPIPMVSDATDRAITSALRTLPAGAATPAGTKPADIGIPAALVATIDTATPTAADTADTDADAIAADDPSGRHRRRPLAAIRRHSTLTLASLIPTGLIGIAGATTGTGSAALLSAHSTDLNDQPDTAPIDTAEAADVTGTQSAEATASTDAASAGTDSYFAAAAGAVVAPAPAAAPVPVVAQTVPGAAGGPALRNLPDLPTSLKSSPLGIPTINLATYVRAERITAERLPGCHMTWELLAGIGRVESSHANDGKVDSDGNLLDPIYGLRLDGSLPGSKVIRDTDGGEYDGDTVYDRAVGPMQFIPQTWKKYATDGTGDGKADPQNLFDAAATTAAYLCDGGLDMRDPAQATRAIMRYNNSRAYATNVSAWSAAYATGVAPRAEDLPKIH